MSSRNPFHNAEVIHAYTRAQAIEDGVLVDLNQKPTAQDKDITNLDAILREAGIIYPCAMTETAFMEWLNPGEQDVKDGQSIAGRLWDMLTIFKSAVNRSRGPLDIIRFRFIVWKNGRQRNADLKAICGPGDTAAPVITFMLPDED
jgi:hypothetical protein